MQQIKSFLCTPCQRILKNATITCHFGFLFEKSWVEKSHDYCKVIVFKKLCFKDVFCAYENEKLAFFMACEQAPAGRSDLSWKGHEELAESEWQKGNAVRADKFLNRPFYSCLLSDLAFEW